METTCLSTATEHRPIKGHRYTLTEWDGSQEMITVLDVEGEGEYGIVTFRYEPDGLVHQVSWNYFTSRKEVGLRAGIVSRLDALAERASKFTGRTLTWSISPDGKLFHLGDKTHLGNLCLAKIFPEPECISVYEVYMRSRNFGLTFRDEMLVAQALS